MSFETRELKLPLDTLLTTRERIKSAISLNELAQALLDFLDALIEE